MHIFSRDEFIAMAMMGERTGQIHTKESRIIQNLLRFEKLKATDIMTPRTVVTALSEDLTIDTSLKYIMEPPFSPLWYQVLTRGCAVKWKIPPILFPGTLQSLLLHLLCPCRCHLSRQKGRQQRSD